MTRAAWLVLGALLLLLAAILREPPRRGEQTTLGAVGRSMGGMRVVVIDGLFFRAEALRRRGRLEDAAGLYHAILELDPANEAATIFLADLFVDGMLPGAVEADARFLWWREAHGVLEDALARRPDAAAVHDRAATLITQLPYSQPDLEPYLVRTFGNWRLEALRHLAVATERTDVLARRGRGHVIHAALLAPDVASRALVAGDEAVYREALRIAGRLQARRADALATVLVDPDRPEPLGALLAAAVAALEATARARTDAGRRPAAEAAFRALDAIEPANAWTPRLRAFLDAPR